MRKWILLAGLAAQLLTDELNTLALIRLRPAERTDLGGHLTDKLLVAALQYQAGILALADVGQFSLYLVGKHQVNLV